MMEEEDDEKGKVDDDAEAGAHPMKAMDRKEEKWSPLHVQGGPALLPLVVVGSTPQALSNLDLIFNAGCQGVLLTTPSSLKVLADAFKACKEAFPERWIGE